MMKKDIYPDGIEQDPMLSTDMDDLQGSGVMSESIYTLKAGQTFVERKLFSADDKNKGSALNNLKNKFSR